jgi:hypothetical protein
VIGHHASGRVARKNGMKQNEQKSSKIWKNQKHHLRRDRLVATNPFF